MRNEAISGSRFLTTARRFAPRCFYTAISRRALRFATCRTFSWHGEHLSVHKLGWWVWVAPDYTDRHRLGFQSFINSLNSQLSTISYSKAQHAEAVEADEHGAAFVGDDPDRQQQTESERGDDEDDDHGQREGRGFGK